MAKKRQALKNVTKASWLFGHPVLRADNNSKANWSAITTSPYYQKGGGWFAELYGGPQTGDDWAAVYIPVNDMPPKALEEAQWSYYMTTSDSYGVNIVIWLHDPDDLDNRVEVTQIGSASGLEKGSGWNAHEFDIDTTQMFFYGELTTAALNTTNLTAGTQYTWAQFQTDPLFKDWVIYRISIEFGWQGSGTFGTAYVAEVKLNEVPIPLVPRGDKHRKTVKDTKTLINTEKVEGDVFSDAVSTNGTRWSWNFGGTGYITKALITHDGAVTPRVRLHLWDIAVTDSEAEMDDSDAFNGPVDAGLDYYVGYIDFPAMHASGTGDAISLVVPGTGHTIPLEFSSYILYGVTETLDTFTPAAATCNIYLTADMEDN